ncbi:DUF5000 domain-containing lipoprotein [Sphingobacterium sp. Mn56C]|uniref:DUF5000 domain-containing lipoprotein n=1 Tax=Sphingobacterium sp. Mn56C TaxID=3395261 RepID=UPI003BEA7241
MKNFKHTIKSALLLGCVSSILWSCKADKGWTLIENDGTKPGVLSNVSVVNGPGKALIKYDLPDNVEVLYVKAEYTMASGQVRSVKSSQYNTQITIDGFADTSPQDITLYTVSKSEVSSDPITVTVKPTTPIYQLVFKELEASATFGGVRINSVNENKGNVVIVPLVDSLGNGDYVPLESVFTSDSVIVSNVRGFKPKPLNFAFYVRDRWLNKSDTLFKTITPFEENLLDRQQFIPLNYPGDAQYQYGTNMQMIFDGNMDPNRWPSLYTVESAGAPVSLTFSLGKEAQISRVVIFPRREAGFYDKGNIRDFEVWGSNNPKEDGSWESWDLLGTYTVRKPSGTPSGTNTGADEDYGRAGWSFDVPSNAPKYKYLRVRNLRNWRGSYFIQMAQLQVWGIY